MTDPTIGPVYLIGVFGVVLSGAVLPVVPTGATVSVAAALAEQDNAALIALVVVAGAAGAYLSDLGTYAVLRVVGRRADDDRGRLGRWLHGQRQGRAVARLQDQLRRHELRALLLSRLVPGGQLPVLVVAALGGYSWRRYATADAAAATLWSVVYTVIGMAGRAVFPEAWEGAAAGIAVVLVLSVAGTLWQRHGARATAETPL